LQLQRKIDLIQQHDLSYILFYLIPVHKENVHERTGSSRAFLDAPIVQVDSATFLVSEAAVAHRLQPLGLVGRARHVHRINQAIHGADLPLLCLCALDGEIDHHEPCTIQKRTEVKTRTTSKKTMQRKE
jgi:hypothetical protein